MSQAVKGLLAEQPNPLPLKPFILLIFLIQLIFRRFTLQESNFGFASDSDVAIIHRSHIHARGP
jgi:hypothetical protein